MRVDIRHVPPILKATFQNGVMIMQINRKIKRFYLGNIRKELKAAVIN